jgi:hypothetical protein
MKENTMEKSIKMEQDLNEEQLQDITGACAQCIKDMQDIQRSLRRAEGQLIAATKTTQIHGQSGATALHRSANANMQRADNFMYGIVARHPSIPSDLSVPPPK